MASTKYTATQDSNGATVEIVVPDSSLIYDAEGNRTVDPTTLQVGDKICAIHGCGMATITAIEAVVLG